MIFILAYSADQREKSDLGVVGHDDNMLRVSTQPTPAEAEASGAVGSVGHSQRLLLSESDA